MVARSPPKPRKKMVAPLDPNQLRETLNKVEKCLNRLQELEYVTSGTKGRSGVNASPRGSRGYLRTIRNGNNQKSPPGKLPTQIGEWKKMSLPAMILGETMGEILQATRFAREIVSATTTTTTTDPKTPVTATRQKSRLNPEATNLRARRKREKQIIRPEPHSPLLQRTKSRINFKVSGSPPKQEAEKENRRLSFSANRVSPKNRPWARKTVIFPNPMFHSSSNLQNQKFSKNESPVRPKNQPVTPHKFLIKTPPGKAAKGAAASSTASVVKFQVKIRSPAVSVSPTRGANKKKEVSPPKKVSKAAKLRRSFSPSRLASRLVSPLKNRRSSVQGCVDGSDGMNMMNMNMNMMSGLKQRPMSTTTRRV
ncbi:putative microtubule-binding protein TANGLED [Bidens hawaiensis]|uniref:putative microtubule-binding protein TANGLED n=1 Tax=Bidens hawaiensis TaxID=980011 RepID=UPI00404A3FE3